MTNDDPKDLSGELAEVDSVNHAHLQFSVCRECGQLLGCPESQHTIIHKPPYIYRRSLDDMRRTSDENCGLCMLLLSRHELFGPKPGESIDCISPDECPWPQESSEGGKVTFLISAVEWGSHPADALPMMLIRGARRQHRSGLVHGEIPGPGIFHDWRVMLEVWTEEDNPAANAVVMRSINPDVSSEQAVAMARRWIDECVSNHPGCARNGEPSLPTRVIEVDPDGLRLKIVDGEKGHYAALSYCWGGPQPVVTDSKSIGDHCSGIPFENLPAAIQDAITMTRKLDIPYLWVDSLCIIQDSADDKNREISKMADIFSDARVVISAARSPNCQTGFLSPCEPNISRFDIFREGPDRKYTSIELPFALSNDTMGSVFVCEHNELGGPEDPINRRAWTLQESVLATCRLIYSRNQLLWKCRTRFDKAGGYLTWDRYCEWRGLKLLQQGLEDVSELQDVDSKRAPSGSEQYIQHALANLSLSENDLRQVYVDRLYLRWYELVKDASSRQLSFFYDLLPSLAGIAHIFQKLTGSEYVAGLWRDRLLEGLMWSRVDYCRAPRPQWRACTWSWAAISSPVFYSAEYMYMHQAAEVVEVNIAPRSDLAPLGEIRGGSLVVKGNLTDIRISWHSSLPFDKSPFTIDTPEGEALDVYEWKADADVISMENRDLLPRHYFSDLNEEERGHGAPAYALPLFIAIRYDEDKASCTLHGLILQDGIMDGIQVFERVGSFSAPGDGWLEITGKDQNNKTTSKWYHSQPRRLWII